MANLDKGSKNPESSIPVTVPAEPEESSFMDRFDDEFWQGAVMVLMAVGLGFVSTKVDGDFHDLAVVGPWLLGIFGIFRMI